MLIAYHNKQILNTLFKVKNIKKYLFFLLLFLLSSVAKAEFTKNTRLVPKDFIVKECVLIKNRKITKDSCLINVSHSSSFIQTVIKFKGIEYYADFYACSSISSYRRYAMLASENEQYTKNDDAIISNKDNDLKISNEWGKYICLKRKKSVGRVYELCIQNVR